MRAKYSGRDATATNHTLVTAVRAMIDLRGPGRVWVGGRRCEYIHVGSTGPVPGVDGTAGWHPPGRLAFRLSLDADRRSHCIVCRPGDANLLA